MTCPAISQQAGSRCERKDRHSLHRAPTADGGNVTWRDGREFEGEP